MGRAVPPASALPECAGGDPRAFHGSSWRHDLRCALLPSLHAGSRADLTRLEAAARAKAAEIGVSLVGKSGRSRAFRELLRDLDAHGVFTSSDYNQWTGLRNLRNATTHAAQQMILAPCDTLESVRLITSLINRLFAQRGEV